MIKKIVLSLLCSVGMLAHSAKGDLVLSNMTYTLAYDLTNYVFQVQLYGAETNKVYVFETTTNLVDWCEYSAHFRGEGYKMEFLSIESAIKPDNFLRVRVLGPYVIIYGE